MFLAEKEEEFGLNTVKYDWSPIQMLFYLVIPLITLDNFRDLSQKTLYVFGFLHKLYHHQR